MGVTSASFIARPALAIFTFHRMAARNGPGGGDRLTAVELERTVAFLKARYRLESLTGALEAMAEGNNPYRHRRIAVITFDDGFRDFLEHAAPVLKRHGAPATLFLTTGPPSTMKLPWFGKLDWLVGEHGAAAIESRMADLAATWRDRAPGVSLRTTFRKHLDPETRDDILDHLWKALVAPDEAAMAGRMFLEWREIRQLAADGVEIGAHTVTHPDLATLPAAAARREIEQSRDDIEERTGKVPATFAYPWGDPASYTEQTIALVREAGFEAAVTSVWGLNDPGAPRFDLKRKGRRFGSNLSLRLETDGWLDLARRVLGRNSGCEEAS